LVDKVKSAALLRGLVASTKKTVKIFAVDQELADSLPSNLVHGSCQHLRYFGSSFANVFKSVTKFFGYDESSAIKLFVNHHQLDHKVCSLVCLIFMYSEDFLALVGNIS
jgi:hypothetical protein